MKAINLFIFASLVTGSLLTGTEHLPKTQEVSIYDIDRQIESTRQAVVKFAHENQPVKDQYDSFVKNLRHAYVKGEGMIDQDIHRILEAVEFSAYKHRLQVRKDPNSTPYIIHPIGVAEHLLVIGHVRNPDILIAALLHDTVEDTDTSFGEILESFGTVVHDYVAEVTDDKSLEKADRKRLQIEHAPHKSAGAAQIKLADKLYNLSDLIRDPPLVWNKEQVDQYFVWAKSVVDALPWVNAPLKEAVDKVIASRQKR